MSNKKFDNLHLALPTVDKDAQKIVRGGNWRHYSDGGGGFIETITVIGTYDPWDPWDDPFFDPFDDPFYDPYDDYGDGGSGGGDPAPPADEAPTFSLQQCIALANGEATQSNMNELCQTLSDVANILGLTASAQGLKTDALANIAENALGSADSSVRALSNLGKGYGIVSVVSGGYNVYLAFSDGDISNQDVIDAVSLGFGVLSFASGPVGLAFGAISLGISIYSTVSGGGSSSGGAGGGGYTGGGGGGFNSGGGNYQIP